MFKVTASRQGSTFEQEFTNWQDANNKSKQLLGWGFSDVMVTPVRVPKADISVRELVG